MTIITILSLFILLFFRFVSRLLFIRSLEHGINVMFAACATRQSPTNGEEVVYEGVTVLQYQYRAATAG